MRGRPLGRLGLIRGCLACPWAASLPAARQRRCQTCQTLLELSLLIWTGFIGGSADLAPSNMTLMKSFGDFQKGQYQERNFRFGVREHGMAAITNGLALHNSGLIPYCATFFIFTGAASPVPEPCCPLK